MASFGYCEYRTLRGAISLPYAVGVFVIVSATLGVLLSSRPCTFSGCPAGGVPINKDDDIASALWRAYGCALLVIAGRIDACTLVLPNPLLASSACCALISLVLSSVNTGVIPALLTVVESCLVYVVLKQVALRSSLGMGDAKLCGVLSLLVADFRLFLCAMVIAIVSAGCVTIVRVIAGTIVMATPIPLGPFLVSGALAALLVIR